MANRMKLVVLTLFLGCIATYSQTTPTKYDPVAQTKQFADKILKEAGWAKVTSAASTDFYVDMTSLKREKNSVHFFSKADKRGNLTYAQFSGNCEDDFYIIYFMYKQEVGDELKLIPSPPPESLSNAGTAHPGTTFYKLLDFACTEGAKKIQKLKGQ